MGKYGVEMSKLLIERENIEKTGVIVGKVSVAKPLQISIDNGQIILYPENLYMCEHLFDDYTREFEEEAKITLNTKTELAKAGVTGQATETPAGHQHDLKLNELDYKANGSIKLTDTLKVGDLVMLVPTIDEQTWFIVDKVRKVE